MLELRQIKLSIFYFLKDKLDKYGWGSLGYHSNERVHLLLGFLADDQLDVIKTPSTAGVSGTNEIVLPIVTLDYFRQSTTPLELGSSDATIRRFMVEIMGLEQGETEDLTQDIYEWLRDNDIPINDYSAGFPPSITPENVGTLQIDSVGIEPIRILNSPNIADKHRVNIIFSGMSYFNSSSRVIFLNGFSRGFDLAFS